MATDEDALRWRVEAACRAAWPVPGEVLLDGWVLRAAGGPSRRANSANPLHEIAAMDEAFVAQVEAFYRERGRPAIFRIPDMVQGIDALLAARGYRIDAPTMTLFAALDELGHGDRAGASIEAAPSERWLAARDAMSGSSPETARAYRGTIGAITLPCGFASVKQDTRIVALGFGVVQDDLLVVESVLTDPAERRRGHARACLAALFGWAAGQGVRSVALQVMRENAAALALYRGLGFSRDLYGYHYRLRTA